MTSIIPKVRSHIGDLWWYSLLLFIACRSGDVIQAIIGLWLVPKYVGQNELGAVLPLQQLSSLFTVPLAIVAIVFSKYVNKYATRGEIGKVKSFIHDVILISSALFLVCIIAAYWLIPHFYTRLNISSGSLTLLVLVTGFIVNISNLFHSAAQGLKKFKVMTITALIGAPIRLATLLIAMPFRALSGYLLGQATPSASCGILTAFSIHKDLKNATVDNTWRKDIPKILKYLYPIAIFTSVNTLCATINATVYRQRLPEIESSAFYLLSRFAELAGYVGIAVTLVLFPIAAEAHEKGEEKSSLLIKTCLPLILIAIGITIPFWLFSDAILNLTDTWRAYLDYQAAMPILTLISGIGAVTNAISTYEMAYDRFAAPLTTMFFNIGWTIFLTLGLGIEFFRGNLPDYFINYINTLHLNNLITLSAVCLGVTIIQTIVLAIISRASTKNALMKSSK